mgnify:CR=1 FL=1
MTFPTTDKLHLIPEGCFPYPGGVLLVRAARTGGVVLKMLGEHDIDLVFFTVGEGKMKYDGWNFNAGTEGSGV